MTHKKRHSHKTRTRRQCPDCLSWHHEPGELCPACMKLDRTQTINPFDFIFAAIGGR